MVLLICLFVFLFALFIFGFFTLNIAATASAPLLPEHLLLLILMILLLLADFRPELLEVLVRLLKNLKQPRVLLRVDHVDVRVEVVVLQRLDPIPLLLVLQHLLLLLLRLQRGLNQDRLLTNVVHLLLVELRKLLGVQEDFIQEFAMPSLFSQFLTRTHLLFEAVQGTRLFFRTRIDFCALVKLTVHQLPLEQVIALSLLSV